MDQLITTDPDLTDLLTGGDGIFDLTAIGVCIVVLVSFQVIVVFISYYVKF